MYPNACSSNDQHALLTTKDVQGLIQKMQEATYVRTNVVPRKNSLQESLDSLEYSLTYCYRRAMEVVPKLVAMETPFEVFLRTDKYHPEQAARRLALYWSYRREIFGERWLLPMTQTGTGALPRSDCFLLQKGFMMYVLAKPQPLFLVDYSNIDGYEMTAEVLGRTTLYVATVICSEALTQTKGLAVVRYVMSKERSKVDFWPHVWEKIRTAYPVVVSRVSVAQAYDPTKSVHVSDFERFRVFKMLAFNTGTAIDVYSGNSVAETVRNLENGGFHRSYIPMKAGGRLDAVQKIADWTRMRLNIEDVMRGHELSDQPRAVPRELAVYASGATCRPKRKRGEDNYELTVDDRRKRSALYCRRYYHRRKLEILSLQEQVKDWVARNETARKESKRFQLLLTQALNVEGLLLCVWYRNKCNPSVSHCS